MRAIRIKTPDLDSGPCVPAALSVVLEKTFDEVNNWLVYRGYREVRQKAVHKSLASGGTKTYRINFKELGLVNVTDSSNKGLSINQFHQRFTRERYVIHVGHHFVAVVNGIIYDTLGAGSEKKRVKQVWVRHHDTMPDDWHEAQRAIEVRYMRIAQGEKIAKQKENRYEYYKKLKYKIREKRKTPEYKLDQLLKRKKSWISKLKRAQTTLKTIERKIKYYQRKNTQS